MTLKDFILERKYLFWDTLDYDSLSPEVVVDHVINYGDFDDFKMLNNVLGIKIVAGIFNKQIKNNRHNYSNKIKNYFQLYFKKYA